MKTGRTPFLVWLAAPLLMAAGSGCEQPKSKPVDQRDPCTENNPLRNVYYGDLHLHTGFSWDAWGYDVHLTPWDAYAFALGGEIALPPLDADGEGTRFVRLARPLDFAMVSDHGEFLGEVKLCTEPGHPAYDTTTCTNFRRGGESNVGAFGMLTSLAEPERFNLCGGTGDYDCILQAASERWADMIQAAEDFYDRTSACSFVTFQGYEYTNTADVVNYHRNVIFRNTNVPDLPVTYFEALTPYELWQALQTECIDGLEGCDVMTIAHNSNLSNGNYFYPRYEGAQTEDEERELAALRIRMEPLVEIFQHKGDMECRNGFEAVNGDPDPLCDFEKQRDDTAEDCGDDVGSGGMRLWGCVSRYDFVRNALKLGLQEEQRLGVNPYKLGIMGSTDSHNGIAGKVTEYDLEGHVGTVDDTPDKRLGDGTVTHDTLLNNPGGLIAVWAEERSRDSIFDAMRRREVFGTSGPRIEVRFFGGWTYPASLCSDPGWLSKADADGVPMGTDLLAQPTGADAPIFLVHAKADPGVTDHPGTPLQRVQIIKGWLGSDGEAYEKVFEVAGDPENGATVDPATCEPQGEGEETLCAAWTDPEFDPTLPAFYYARVVENPSCRWSTWECLRIPAADRPAVCDDPALPKIIQERAWTSPIWYTP